MIEIYLWLNAIIYTGFAIWCTLKKQKTSVASGYLSVNNSGWSEYLVIYGGLQIGLGLFFAYLALIPALYGVGIIFSVLFYVPVVLYRLITIVKFKPVNKVTLAIAAMEICLLAGALILLYAFRTYF